jgi:hypothetical protein
MTLDRRLDNLEESLSPREAIICWLRDVHEFESYGAYCRWLLDQPDDAYPLIKLTSQVRAGVRSNHKGTPGVLLKDELRRAEKEVIFLYYVQKELNLRLYLEEEVLRVWAYHLTQKLRLVIQGKGIRDDLHLARLDLDSGKSRRAGKAEKRAAELLVRDKAEFQETLRIFHERVLAPKKAAELLSRRYFAGEELLFADLREEIDLNLRMVGLLKGLYEDQILFGAPEGEREFRAYMLYLGTDGKEGSPPAWPETEPSKETEPDVSAKAREIAHHIVLAARAETLENLGEEQAAEAASEVLLRSLAKSIWEDSGTLRRS